MKCCSTLTGVRGGGDDNRATFMFSNLLISQIFIIANGQKQENPDIFLPLKS